MAQSSSYFTHRHGSTKSHTYQRLSGMQITKDRVSQTTNQRTEGQMVHRCMIHTMSDAHAWLRPIFGNLWNGAPAGRKQLSAFREANYNILRHAALGGVAGFTFSPYEETTIPMGYFKVTNGRLPYSGHLFQNGVNGEEAAVTEFFNVTQAGSSWYECLSSIGLKPLDRLALFILIYSPITRTLSIDTFYLQITDHADVIIGQQGNDDLVSITPSKVSNAWQITKDAGRILKFSLPSTTRDISDSILITSCFQVAKDGAQLLCSNGYLWHWSDNVDGLTFPQALATYPGDKNILNIPQEADTPLYVDLGLPSGILWATRNIDTTKPNKFATSPFTYDASFFSWGNIDAHNLNSNGTFDYIWGKINNSYPWYEGQPYGLTEGCKLTSDIPLTNDAAYNICGHNWHIPSEVDFYELFNNCFFVQADGHTVIDNSVDNKLITKNGVVGIYLKSKINGNHLFFACCGNGYNSGYYNKGGRGRYWSNTYYDQRYAKYLLFQNVGFKVDEIDGRFYGFPIRPVYIRSRGRGLPDNNLNDSNNSR